jgi:hypothetical protein
MIPLRTSLCSLNALSPAFARLASSSAVIAVRRASNHRGVVRPLSQPLLFNQKGLQRSASSAPARPDSLCWKCLAPLHAPQSIRQAGPDSLIAPLFFCASKSCGVIQPPSAETNLFDLFALYGALHINSQDIILPEATALSTDQRISHSLLLATPTVISGPRVSISIRQCSIGGTRMYNV